MNEAPNPARSPNAAGPLPPQKAPQARSGERPSKLTPDPEVAAKGQRRRFTAEYKRRILAEVERCKKPGEIAALLRREGLYSSHIASWRGARDRGELASGAAPRKRGPKPKLVDPSAKRIAELERELAKTKARAERAELLVEAQKKMAALLESLQRDEEDAT
jgi:transposase-like protein